MFIAITENDWQNIVETNREHDGAPDILYPIFVGEDIESVKRKVLSYYVDCDNYDERHTYYVLEAPNLVTIFDANITLSEDTKMLSC